MTRVTGAIFRMLVSKQLTLVVSGVGMVVLARLLTPEDFGIFATVLAVFLLLEIAIRFGLSEYLISTSRLSTGMLRGALGLSLTLAGGVIALALLFLLSPLSDWLEPALHSSLLAMIPGLVVLPLILVPEAALRRRLDFGLLAKIAVGSVAADVIVSISLASLGAGPLALVGGLVASRFLQAAILVSRSGRLLRPRWTGWRPFMAFSKRMTATALLPKSSELAIVLVIPSAFGVAALGIYNRALTVIGLLDKVLLDGVGPVVLPAISDRLRAGASVASVYSAKTARLSILIWPVFAVLALLAEPVVLTLLGDQWIAAIPVVRILCAAGLFLPFTSMSMQFFAATNKVGDYLRIQTLNQFARLVLVAAGAFHSLEAVALGLALSKGVKAFHVRRGLHRMIGGQGRPERRLNYLKAALTALLSLAGPAMLLTAAPGASPVVLFVAGMCLAAIGWLAGVILTAHPLVGDLRTLPVMQRSEVRMLKRFIR